MFANFRHTPTFPLRLYGLINGRGELLGLKETHDALNSLKRVQSKQGMTAATPDTTGNRKHPKRHMRKDPHPYGDAVPKSIAKAIRKLK